MQSSGSSSAATVSFTTMAEGTREDYELLAGSRRNTPPVLPTGC